MDAHFDVTIFQSLYWKSIIEIFRVFRVNGECYDGAKVSSSYDFFTRDSLLDGIWLRFNFFRKAKWQAELSHDGMNFRFILSRFPQYFDYFRFRTLVAFCPGRNFNHNFVTRLCFVNIFWIDKKVLVNFPKVRNNERVVPWKLKLANETCSVAFNDFSYFTFGMLSVSRRKNTHLHGVSINRWI